MTAIDFATLFCSRLLKSPTSLMESATLCAIAAGIDTAADIAHTINQPTSNTTTTLHRLAKKDLIRRKPLPQDNLTITYALTPAGKTTVTNLINFLQHY